jgi:hypothetical protein
VELKNEVHKKFRTLLNKFPLNLWRSFMKKIMIFIVLTSTFIFSLAGCTTEGKGELTRIDLLIENKDETHIQDQASLTLTENLFKQIKWDPNNTPSMARKEDVKAVFYYEKEKNMPESIYEYVIWLNEKTDTATIISNDEKEGYGELNKNNAITLKNILIK